MTEDAKLQFLASAIRKQAERAKAEFDRGDEIAGMTERRRTALYNSALTCNMIADALQETSLAILADKPAPDSMKGWD